jgi:hypothetical protein
MDVDIDSRFYVFLVVSDQYFITSTSLFVRPDDKIHPDDRDDDNGDEHTTLRHKPPALKRQNSVMVRSSPPKRQTSLVVLPRPPKRSTSLPISHRVVVKQQQAEKISSRTTYRPTKSTDIQKRFPQAANNKGDNDVWVERFYMNKRMQPVVYYRSVTTQACVRGEPPTGASKIVYLEDLLEQDEDDENSDEDDDEDDEKYKAHQLLYNVALEPLPKSVQETFGIVEKPAKTTASKNKKWKRRPFAFSSKKKKSTKSSTLADPTTRSNSKTTSRRSIGFGSTILLLHKQKRELADRYKRYSATKTTR